MDLIENGELAEYYAMQRQKIYGINGNNDYVSPLGNCIISEENIYFVETPLGIKEMHLLDCMLKNGRINWPLDENGNLIRIEQGPYGKFVKEFSKIVMSMKDKEIQNIAMSIMSLLECAMGDEDGGNGLTGSGDRKFATSGEMIDFMAKGIPKIILKLGQSKEAKGIISSQLKEYFKNILKSRGGYLKLLACIFIGPVVLSIALGLGTIIWTISIFLMELKDVITQLAGPVKEIYMGVYGVIKNLQTRLSNWYNKKLNKGYKYATANPQIVVDTYKLRAYADRLLKVNSRLHQISSRLDSLCSKLNVSGFFNGYSDLRIGYNQKITASANYLNSTADEFDKVEQSIIKWLG